jgi:uncharacterized membrane protein YkoI
MPRIGPVDRASIVNGGRRKVASILLVMAASTLALYDVGMPVAHADRHEEQDLAKSLKEAGDIQSLETIIARAKGEHPGRLLEAELKKRGERYIYEIELVDAQGMVWELYYDARTGDPISPGEGE